MNIKNLPNYITIFRILATCCLLFIDAFSVTFFVVYTLAGLSDILDGFIARRLKITSELGAKLDSVADLLFYAVMVFKVFSMLLKKLPMGVWCLLGTALVVRMITYGVAAAKYGQFASLHTYLNKATGAIGFTIPYVIKSPAGVVFCALCGTIALLAAVEELVMHLRNKQYSTDKKTLLWREG